MKKDPRNAIWLFLVLTFLIATNIPFASAEDNISYLEWTGTKFETKTTSQYTSITASIGSTWSTGTYVVTGTVTIHSRITVSSNSAVKLILCDDAELNVKGINISSGTALHIYGQRAGTGILNTTGEIGNYNTVNDNGIGKTGINASGTLNIYGGTVHATGGAGGDSPNSDSDAGSGGSGIRSDGKLTVYGGNLVATGGIGGAGYSGGQNGSHGKAIAGEFTIGDNITLQTEGASGSFSQSGTYKGTWTSVTLEYNSPHTHSWSINTDPSHVNTATVCCESANCPYGNNTEYTVIIQASEQSKMYDGQPVTASFTRSDDFPEEITVSGISYTGRDGTAYAGCPASPSSVGKYTASATVSDGTEGNSVRISVPFEITAKAISWTVANTTHTYDGTPHGLQISVTNPSAGAEIRYKDAEGLYSLQFCPSITNVSDSPKTVYFQITAENYETVTGSAEIIVNPAATLNASALTTDQRPTACSLTYNGEGQPLVTAPSETIAGYTVQYSLDGNSWSEAIPTGKNAGEYTVLYKYAGDLNHYDYPADGGLTITGITIGQKEVSLNWAQTELTYNEEPQVPSVTAEGLCGSDECTVTVTGAETAAGTHIATATGLSNRNYKLPASVTREYTISPLTVSAPTITLAFTETEYTGSELKPAVLSVMNGSTVIDPGEYTVTYSENINAGTANVRITDKSGGNYAVSGSATFQITKANPVVTAPRVRTDMVYSGESQSATEAAGSATGGTMMYAITPKTAQQPDEWQGTVLECSFDAGEYRIWYKVEGGRNYQDVSPGFVDFTVAPKPITIVSGITAEDKTYDGTRAATLCFSDIDWAACGKIGNDDLSVTAIGTFCQADAGKDLIVALTNLTLTGAKAGNYILDVSGSQATTTANILKADSSVKTAPQAKTLTSAGTAHPLVTAGEASGGKMLYALGADDQEAPEDELFTEEIPAAVDEGVYHVWYKCSGDANHTDTKAACISVTVEAALLDPEPEPDPEPQQEPDPGSDPEVGGENPNPNPDPDPEPQQEQPAELPASQTEQETPAQPEQEPQINPGQELPSQQPVSPPGQETPTQPQSDPQQENPSDQPVSLPEQETPAQPEQEPQSEPEQSEQPTSPSGQETPTQPEQGSQTDPEQELPSEQPASPSEQETPIQPEQAPQADPQQEQPSEPPVSPSTPETPAQPDTLSQPESQLPVEQPVSPPVQETSPEPESLLPENPVVPQPELVEAPTLPEPSSESEQLPATVSASGGKYSIDEGKKTAVYTGPEDTTASSVTIPAAVSVDGVSYPVTEIRAKAFQGMAELEQITIGKNVTIIGKNAFSGCSSLNEVTFKGKKVVTIGDSAFRKCVSLTEVTIPAGIKVIGKKAFEGCRNLKTVTIKTKKLTSVGKKAFKGISAKAQFKCPKKLLASYTEMMRNAGAPKNAEYMKQ